MKRCPTCSYEWDEPDILFCPNDGTALRPSGIHDMIGTVVADRYSIIRKLGEGAMGVVYLGEHIRMKRLSAIKVIHPEMATITDAVARFTREAANASKIHHRNVCAIHDFGETPDGRLYLAMEYVEGETLSEVVEREGPLPPKRAALLVKQAARALDAAHKKGIVHRDLKPDNIMVTRAQDGSDTVKVVDFGIAKAIGGESGQDVTQTGFVVGTPSYMSPEQLKGSKIDGRSDIYSLALVLFRVLTDSLPFTADTLQEIMMKRIVEPPLKLADVAPNIAFPPQLQAALDRALQQDPAKRYSNAFAFADDVFDAVNEPAVAAPAISMPPDKTRVERRPSEPSPKRTKTWMLPAAIGAAAAVTAAIVAASTGTPARPPTANAGPDQTVPDADNNGAETVTLDGSGSSDPDGSIVSYVWTENGQQIASGVNTAVNLDAGTHNITLTVTDNGNPGLTGADDAVITINTSPTKPDSVVPPNTTRRVSVSGIERIRDLNQDAVAQVYASFPNLDGAVTGTAFAISTDGLMLTNHHVVTDSSTGARATEVRVQFDRSEQIFAAEIIATDSTVDLALLRVTIPGGVPTIAGFNTRMDTIPEGMQVAVIGFALGGDAGSVAQATASEGQLVTVNARRVEYVGDGAVGASGSPVFDGNGELIAVLFGGRRGTRIVVGTPADVVRNFVRAHQ